jgi:hypothetical protein
MTAIYGTVTLGDSKKFEVEDDRGNLIYYRDKTQPVKITLKGRKFYKYIEVAYEDELYYGQVPPDVTVGDFKFECRATANFRLYGVEIRYGDGENDVVYCKPDKKSLDKDRLFAKTAYYHEITEELGVKCESDHGAEHVDKILESIRGMRIIQGTDIATLIAKIDTLQRENAKLKEDLIVTSDWLKKSKRLLEAEMAENKTLREDVNNLREEQKDYKKVIKTRLLKAINGLEE